MLLLSAMLVLGACGYSDNDESAYSPISVEALPEDLSEPESVSKPINLDSYELATGVILENLSSLDTTFTSNVDKTFLDKVAEVFGADKVEALANALENGAVSGDDLYSVIGYTEKTFLSLLNNDLERTTVLEDTDGRITDMVFVGDVSFSDGYSVMNKYTSRGKGVEGIVSEEVLEIMRSATVAMANNEFTFTTRGAPIKDKIWTFRGKPENVSIYYEMGVDIVGLANNHAFDYGPDSLTDTLATLDNAGIARLGAGENLEEAKAPYYYIREF